MDDGNDFDFEKRFNERLDDVEHAVIRLTGEYRVSHDRIKENRQGVRAALGVLVFGAIVWGIPIAEVKWSGKEFSFTRSTSSPELVILGGLVASALFAGDKPIEILKDYIAKK